MLYGSHCKRIHLYSGWRRRGSRECSAAICPPYWPPLDLTGDIWCTQQKQTTQQKPADIDKRGHGDTDTVSSSWPSLGSSPAKCHFNFCPQYPTQLGQKIHKCLFKHTINIPISPLPRCFIYFIPLDYSFPRSFVCMQLK